MSKFCTNCGAKLEDDSIFCEECGMKVIQSSDMKMTFDVDNEESEEPEYTPKKNASGTRSKSGMNTKKRSGGGVRLIIRVASAALLLVSGISMFTGKSEPPAGKPPKQEIVASQQNFKEKNEAKGESKDTDKEKAAENSESSIPSAENADSAQIDNTSQGLNGADEDIEYFPTVYGGEWDQADGKWFYIIDDEIVTNSWIEDDGKAYFVDDRGIMLTDCYTPDGYYVGSDGAYIPDADMGIVEIENNSDSASASGNGAEIAAALSTANNAKATDFEWFVDYVLNEGSDAGRVITDSSYSRKVTDASALNGGWKAFMFTDVGVYGSDVERYFNVDIDTNGNKFDMTVNWKYFFDPVSGSSVDETHTDTFEGSYSNGSATAQSTYAKVDLDEFYLSNDGKTEYAIGTFYWISGETDRIGLMRSAR